jgi:hypothetical protein
MLVGVVVLTVLPASGAAQSEGSRAAAARLSQLLESRGLDAIGARDPAAADRFIAALHIPGDQLLVVAGHHPTPALLDHRIQQKAFRELYLDLQATPTPKGKLFVMDSRGDGLRASREQGESFDIVYEDGTKTTAFDGDWEGQKLNESEYRQRFADLDRQYAHMLELLVAALQQPAPAQHGAPS